MDQATQQQPQPYRRNAPRESVPDARPRREFRWWMVTAFAAVCVGLWVIRSVDVAFSWDDVMDWLNVHDRERYTRLASLAVLFTVAVLAIRFMRRRDERRD